MVILGLLGAWLFRAWLSQDRYPSVAMACDNGHPSLQKNIAARKCIPTGFIHPRFSIAARLSPFP
jgi:hypothetical protein